MYILGRQSGESGKSRQRNGYRKVSVEKKVVAYRENIKMIDMQIEHMDHMEIDERKNV